MRFVFALALIAGTQIASADKIDDYIRREMARQRIPGLSLAIIRDGKVVKAAGYGIADLDNDVRVRPDTVFETASITKQFTASLIMMLVQEGKVGLDDKINTYLKEPPEKWKDVTVRQLLSHTGGISRIGIGFGEISKLRKSTTEEMFAALKKEDLEAAPGEKHAYSDAGYFLLGMIIEKVTGQKFADALAERILRPLKMDASRMQDHLLPYKRLAKGYTIYTGPEFKGVPTIVNIQRVYVRGLASHYGLFSTVLDLAKWDAALHTNSPLTRESKEQMWTTTKLADGSTHDYGFGWYVGARGGQRYTFHSGITGTGILRFPDLKLSVIVLTNLGMWGTPDSSGTDADKIVKELAAIVHPQLNRPIPDPAPARTARARVALEAFARGSFAHDAFIPAAWETIGKYMPETLAAVRPLGEIRKLELIEITRKGKVEFRAYRVTGSKATGMLTFVLDPSGLLLDVFPQG